MIYINYSIIEKPVLNIFLEYLKLMPIDIQSRIKEFKRWQDAYVCLIGRLLLKQGLKDYGFKDSVLKEITYDRYRRPFLTKNIDFNISHSENVVVSTISDSSRVGIDLELIKPIEIVDFRSVMTENEWLDIAKKEDMHRTFYSIWTKKEAVIKADGRGLNIPLKTILLESDHAILEEKRWELAEVSLGLQNYQCHLASSLRKDIFLRKTDFFNI